MSDDERSPDEALGTETFRQGDVAEDERELEELGAQLDNPERVVTLQGGMDDPDGIDPRLPRNPDDREESDLSAPLAAGEEGDDPEDEPTSD
jgi:hypothetical protein